MGVDYGGSMRGKIMINWGSGRRMMTPSLEKAERVVNHPMFASVVSNKHGFFKAMEVDGGPRIPEWTTSAQTAVSWADDGALVVGRETNTGSGGRGIVFFSNEENDDLDAFLKCRLYTKYQKSAAEYRVHMAFGKVIDVTKKALPHGTDRSTLDTRIRSHRNGFVFIRNDIHVPDDVYDQAKKAYVTSKLDYGAMDVIYNQTFNRAYVLEMNTAPGLEGTTLDNYVMAFKENL
jgi:glutathione synthase/RimK-type ligase-like ATP-grasp enzyme